MVYLDNAANAPVFPEVLEAMLPWLRPDHVGNPGSLHTQGVNAREAVENARRQVAKMIGADPSEVFFTSGGTESNNAWLQNFGSDLILTTALEHDSVLEPMSAHCHRHYIKVHKDGSVDLNDLERFLSDAHAGEWIKTKAEQYYDGPDPVGHTHVREGVVCRIVNRPKFAAYKHKNFAFKALEGLIKDTAAAPDMEEAQDVGEQNG